MCDILYEKLMTQTPGSRIIGGMGEGSWMTAITLMLILCPRQMLSPVHCPFGFQLQTHLVNVRQHRFASHVGYDNY